MAHPELNELLNALLKMAEMLLKKQGEFLPIGAIILADGSIRHVGGKIDGDDRPPSHALIDLLTETFKKEAARGTLRAAGLCYDVLTIPPGKDSKQDTICCALEHRHGETVNVFKPYVIAANGQIQYGEIFATKRKPQFFQEVSSC